MTVHFQSGEYTLLHGDCIEQMRSLPDESIDAVVTDPPYGLEFMGKGWDGADGFRRSLNAADAGRDSTFGRMSKKAPEYRAGALFQDWCAAWTTEAFRVLKPGGHILAFGGTRTWHRLAVAVEDAGFDIRDSIAWLYGSGFPKSLDVATAIDKADGATRQVIGARRGNVGMPGGNYAAGGASGQVPVTATATAAAQAWEGWGTALKPAFEPIVVARKPTIGTVAANVLAHGTGALNIDATRVQRAEGDRTEYGRDKTLPHANTTASMGKFAAVTPYTPDAAGRWPTNVILDDTQAAALDDQTGVTESRIGTPRGAAAGAGWGMTRTGTEYDDAGGASRFFPTFRYEAKAPTAERPVVDGVAHPTVKPLELMRWLVRLVTPPGGTVLEPFAGSGTTVEACIREGFACIAIEREATYLPLILARIQKDQQQSLLGDWDGAA